MNIKKRPNHKIYIQVLRQMSPEKRLLKAFELSELKGKKVKVLPDIIVQLFAWAGDIMKFCGIKEPPFSSFRLANMRADTSGIPTGPIEKITGPLPYSMEQGVEETIAWLREYELIK
jgi:hypothetical protein